jgi:hypothetical protein
MVVKKFPANDNTFMTSSFLVEQIMDKVSDYVLTINYYITGEAYTHYLPHTEEIMVLFVAVRTNIYQQCNTHDFTSLAYIVHGEDTSNLLIDPEGIMNRCTVTLQLIVNSLPPITPYPQRQHFGPSADVYRQWYPCLSSMPRRMFKACRSISVTCVFMLSKDSLNQYLTNTRPVHVDHDAFGVAGKGLASLVTGLRVQVISSDAPVTVSIRNIRVLPNTDIQVSSTTFHEDNTRKKTAGCSTTISKLRN